MLVFFIVNLVNGIKKLSNCKVKLDDGSIIDLSSKDNAANPRSYKDPPYYTYYYNPCTAITCSSNEDTAVIQVCKFSITFIKLRLLSFVKVMTAQTFFLLVNNQRLIFN
jgi:hypothetical protein